MTEVLLAGTGGMLPLKDRFLTGLYVRQGGNALLIDCGEGMQVALAAAERKLSRINAILLTHAHADHVTGLPGLLLSLGNCSRGETVKIYFPQTMLETVQSLLTVCGGLPYDVILIPLPAEEGISFECPEVDPLLTVHTLPLKHSVPCIGYRLEFGKRPRFEPEKAEALGVPVREWKLLQNGESVTLGDGRTVEPAEVTGGAREPDVITYVTDTLPFGEIAGFAKGSGLFVCEGMYGDVSKKSSMDAKGHMLMQDACELAKKAEVSRLWLTHYSPAEKDPSVYTDELRKIFPAVTVCSDGCSAEL